MSSVGSSSGPSGNNNLNDPSNPKLKSLGGEGTNPTALPSFTPDNLKAALNKTPKAEVPSNMFNANKPLILGPAQAIPSLSTGDPVKDLETFNKLYSSIGHSYTERFTGKEAEIATKILLNKDLRSLANDQQRVKLMRVCAYATDYAKESNTGFYNNLVKGIDNVIEDAKASGKMNKLMEYLFIEMSNTGVLIASMDDWGARKIAGNPKLLNATNASQKTNLLYELKFAYTGKDDMRAINTILKNAVDNGQFKSILGHWTDGLDMTSSKFDALYSNMSGKERADFLQIVSDGIAKEKIGDVMDHLYGATKVYGDVKKLNKAQALEKEGKLSEAGKLYVDLGNADVGQKLLSQGAAEAYKNGNYGTVAGNYLYSIKAGFKNAYNTVEDNLGSFKGNRLTRVTSSYVGDRVDDALKNFPILQSKNILEIKEKREKQLEKLSKLPPNTMTEAQKEAAHQEFETKIDNLTGTKSYPGNNVKLLLNGPPASERLLKRIEGAKDSIFIEVFLWHDDASGNKMADALIKKAEEGKDVRVIIDGPSNLADLAVFKKMKNSKVKIFTNKGSFSNIIEDRGMSAYHRKLYIVDQKYAFTGGINVGDEYFNKGKWHDLLVEVKGPVMATTLNDFYKHWNYSSGEPESKLEKAPPSAFFNVSAKDKANDLPVDSVVKARLLTTDPVQGKKNIKTWMLEAIKNANTRVLIQDPYFNDPEVVDALKVAINKGVKVQVIFPNSNDMPIMKHLDDTVIDQLYAEGADSYLYNTDGKESFNHLKATVVDDYVALGSSNKDTRAMNTNQEINYIFDGKDFADQVVNNIFENDKKNSTYAEPTPDNFVKRLVKLTLTEIPSVF
jgi:cardiolipin synthase